MTLKQLTNFDRIIFLRKFTAELMFSIVEEQEKIKRIKIEKLKQKFIQPKPLPEQTFKKIIKSPVFEPTKELKKRDEIQKQRINQLQKIQEEKKIQKFEELKKESPKKISFIEKLRKPIFHRTKQQKPISTTMMRKSLMLQQISPQLQKPIQQIQKSIQPSKVKPSPRLPEEDIRKIKLEAEPRPQGFALGKIEQLLKDKSIQSIECSGPGKKILIKKLNKINATPLILSQSEITTLIQTFAQQAKIPIMGGILKAAVGDLIMSAVISEYVGSRFIINKITPYSQLGIK